MTAQELNKTVEAVKNGDSSAFEKLYDELYEPLRFYVAKRIGSTEDAKDIAQDTFVTALEKIGELKSAEAFKVWLYKIAYNKTNAYFKEANRYAAFETADELNSVLEQAEEYSEPMYVPYDYLENMDTQEQIRRSIDELSPDRRSALIMFYYENMRIKDIAAAMGTNENAVAHRLSEARKQIADKLKKLGHGNLVLAPLPKVLAVLEEKAKEKGGAFVSLNTPLPAAAVSSATAAKVIAAAVMALAIGSTGAVLAKLDSNKMGNVRLPDSSVSESMADVSLPPVYTYTVTSAPENDGTSSQTQTTTSAPSTSAQTTASSQTTTAPVMGTQPQNVISGSAPAVTASYDEGGAAAQAGTEQVGTAAGTGGRTADNVYTLDDGGSDEAPAPSMVTTAAVTTAAAASSAAVSAETRVSQLTSALQTTSEEAVTENIGEAADITEELAQEVSSEVTESRITRLQHQLFNSVFDLT